MGHDLDSEFALENATQPDLLFVSDAEVVAIEMKVDAKCSLEQVLKYALLGLRVELRTGEPRRRYLAVLGKGSFARQWGERFATIADLGLAVDGADLGDFLGTRPALFREHEGRCREIVACLALAYVGYADLAAFLSSPPHRPLTRPLVLRSTGSSSAG